MTNNDVNLHQLCRYLYGIFALTMILQMVPQTLLIGFVGMVCALIMTYSKQEVAKNTVYESHFQWMLRTFWIGLGVYVPVMIIVAAIIILPTLDYAAMSDALLSGAVQDEEQLLAMMMKDKGPLMMGTAVATMGPCIIWWLWRCWKGYKALGEAKPVENVSSWI